LTYKDKNETILKVGDSLTNQKGEVFTIENIRGVTMLVTKHENKRIKSAKVFSKIDLSEMEKIV